MNGVIKTAESAMEKSLRVLEREFTAMRVGRANPNALEKVLVDYYGTPTPINQLAAVSVVEARTLVVQPWDASVLREVEKALHTSDLGISPQNDGKVIRLIFPQLTQESRSKIAKEVSKMAEDSKIVVRGHRRDALEKLKKMKKNSEIAEDELKSGEKRVQDLTNKFCKEIDDLAAKKEAEVMEI